MGPFILWVILALCPFSGWAMIKGEGTEGHLIWVEKGQFIIDKGAGDGIAPGEYVQVLQNKRYKSRAISLKVEGDYSLWAVYNSYESLILDKKILLKSSTRHTLTGNIKSSMNLDIPPREEFLARIRPRKRRIEGDEREDRDLLLRERLREKFAKKDRDDLAYDYIESHDPDLNDLVLSINVAPASFKNISGSHEMAYRVSLRRDKPDKHVVEGMFSYERNSFVDSAASSVTSESRYDLRLFYEYGRVSKSFRPFSFLSFERMREGSIYPIRKAFNVGPVGLKYEMNAPTRYAFLSRLNLSYIPSLDYWSRDEFMEDLLTNRRGIGQATDVNFRHNIILRARADFFEKRMELSNMTLVRPIQKLNGVGIDFSDINLRVETEMKYRFHRYFSGSYINLVLNDQRSARLSNLPETEITHMFTVGYEKRF